MDDLNIFQMEFDDDQYNFCPLKNIFNNENEMKCDNNSVHMNQYDGNNQKVTPKINVPVRILHDNIKYLYHQYIAKYPEYSMSETSFRKNIPKYFTTKANKKTDICNICQQGKRAIKIRMHCKDESTLQQVINS